MRILPLSWLFLIPFFTFLFTGLVSAQCLPDQSSLLLQLQKTLDFNLTFSVKLVNWTQGNDCCGWTGVACDQNGRVTGLDLNSESIKGGINQSSSLFSLKFLERLNLANNSLNSTPFPSSIGNLTNLVYLNLSNTGFSGQIPIELSHLTRLVTLDLAYNLFNGSIPLSLFSLRSLQKMQLSNNQFGGQVARFPIGSLSPLHTLDLSSNKLEGSIPSYFFDFGPLKYLYVLNLSHNVLTGHIPSSLGDLIQLESLDLSMNKLNGSIPEQLSGLPFLSFLNLSFNQLVGRIPLSTQIQSFSETSFEGNRGLCGLPLNTSCSDVQMPAGVFPLTPDEDGDLDFEPGIYISVAVGFVVGLGSFIGALALCKRWRQWYYKHVDQVLERTFHLEERRRRRNRRKRAYRDPIRRL